MAVDFKLPDLGEGIHEAEMISIKVKEGERVEEDQPIFEVETDKAVVEIPSPYAGVVQKIHVSEGQTVTVGSIMVSFELEGQAGKEPVMIKSEATQESIGASASVGAKSPVPASSAARSNAALADTVTSREGNGRGHGVATHDRSRPVPAAPAVRRLARELGVDLYDVGASGPGGRVLKEDVRAFAAGTLESRMSASSAPTSPAELSLADKYGGKGDSGGALATASGALGPAVLPDFAKYGDVERLPLKSIRRKIAMSMTESWTRIPHVTTFDEADVTELTELQEYHFESFKQRTGARLTLTVLMIKAVVSALKRFPQFNSSLDEASGEIVFKRYYNIGIAVATDRGLIVPVIKDADKKSLKEIALELQDIAEKTRAGKIELDRLQGGTFTITNIGAIGGTSMSPMINFPEAAILGMARAKRRPVVIGDDIAIGTILPLALSFDHRLADGAEAAYFVQHIVSLLEDPFNFVLEG